MKRRVLVLANSGSGLYDFRGTLVKRLIDEGCDVLCAVPDARCVKDLKALGARVVHTPMNRRGKNPMQELRLYGGYRKLIQKERPDIVLTYTIKPNIYGGYACQKEGVPYLATVTGLGSVFQGVVQGTTSGTSTPSTGSGTGSVTGQGAFVTLVASMYRTALKDCACLFFQNTANKQVFEELRIPQGRTRLVNGSGVDLQRHKAEPYPGHEDDVTQFLYVGRLMTEKGSAELLDACDRLFTEAPKAFHLTCVGYAEADGQGDELRQKTARALNKGYLTQLPYDTDIHPYYTRTDAVVMPSYHEGMSNVLMEAAATARPGLASDIPGCQEIITDGETGLLFPARDTEALYEAMKRFLSLSVDARRKMGEAARAKMEREFDREQITEAYAEEILTICT